MARLVKTLSKNPICYLLHRMNFLLLIALALAFFGYCYPNPRSQMLESILTWASKVLRKTHGEQGVRLSNMLNLQPDVLIPSRKDVLPVTPCLAPIIWDRAFNTDILNEQFQLQNITIGLTVFVVKKIHFHLKLFLKTAEMYFMVGHRVNYYIFTHWPDYVPCIPLQKGQQIVILKVQSCANWQEISMHRMEGIRNFTEQRFYEEVNYLICANVDMKFSDHVGMEILSSLFGTLHSDFYELSQESFPYERQPQSQAHIPDDEGDFYYTGALFVGSMPEVYKPTKACHEMMVVDQANHIEAMRNDESHLNKYLLYHKPTKIVSPEYMWTEQKSKGIWDEQKPGLPYNIKRIRFKTVNLKLPRNQDLPKEASRKDSERGDGQAVIFLRTLN